MQDADALAKPAELPSAARGFIRELLRSPKGLTGFVLVMAVLLVALLAPVLALNDPAEQMITHRFLPPVWEQGGKLSHPLGGDNLGRDIYSRVVHGTRVSVVVALIVISVIVVFGTAVGLASGYFGRIVDSI